MKPSTSFSPEVRERAVRKVREHEGEHESQWAAMGFIATKIGCTAETLRRWVRQAERDSGEREGVTTAERERIQSVGARGTGTTPGQRDSAPGIGLFCPGGARPPIQAMNAFVDAHRAVHGVEPIGDVLPITPSTYYLHAARRTDPGRRSARALLDERLREQIQRVWNDRFQVYGARKVWRQLQREGVNVARRTVERLMRLDGLWGVVRGKPVKTTVGDPAMPCPLDRVRRPFQADCPNALWVADFT